MLNLRTASCFDLVRSRQRSSESLGSLLWLMYYGNTLDVHALSRVDRRRWSCC